MIKAKVEQLKRRDFSSEFHYNTSRSSGPGGQNVNKVNTKVELRFNVIESVLLSDKEKALVRLKLVNRITSTGDFQIIAQTERSQFKNKQNAIDKFYELLAKALSPQKRRVATRPTRGSKERRLDHKKQQGQKKANRNFKY